MFRRRGSVQRLRDARVTPSGYRDATGEEAERLFEGLYAHVREEHARLIGNSQRGKNRPRRAVDLLESIDHDTLVARLCRAVLQELYVDS